MKKFMLRYKEMSVHSKIYSAANKSRLVQLYWFHEMTWDSFLPYFIHKIYYAVRTVLNSAFKLIIIFWKLFHNILDRAALVFSMLL